MTLLLFVLGLGLLVLGGELLVRGASRIAAAAGVSPLVIGLTIVAFGTSSPELAVSVQAGLRGQSDIAAANVVGSNIFNLLFVLGLASVVAPLVVARQIVRQEVPVMIGVSALVLMLAADGRIGRIDGAVLLTGIAAYTLFLIVQSRRQRGGPAAAGLVDEYDNEFGGKPAGQGRGPALAIDVALVVAGLGLLVLGGRWLVNGAVALATWFGISEVVIGLTIVAAGTSLPEVATSVIATLRGERDIAVGNAVGSNTFNLLAILGASSLVTPGGLTVAPSLLRFDMVVMLAVAVACLPIFFTGMLIARWEGVVFLAYYAAYVLYLVLDATGHDALPAFSNAMLLFAVPITVLTLALLLAASRTRDAQAPRTRDPSARKP